MKFFILVMCVVFTKYCCVGVDIDATDDDKKKQDLSEEAVDAAKSFKKILMPGPRIFYETSTQTASSTGLILEAKKENLDRVSDSPTGPEIIDESPTQTTSIAGITEENKKVEDGLPDSPSSMDRTEQDESVGQNMPVATNTGSIPDEMKNTSLNKGDKNTEIANSAVILDDRLQSTTEDETQEKPMIPVDAGKKQNNGTTKPLLTDTQKNIPVANLAETPEKKTEVENKDVEKDEDNNDEELVELVPSTDTTSEINDGRSNMIQTNEEGGVVDGSVIINNNHDEKNDEKENKIVPQISGEVLGNSTAESKVSDDGTQSETVGSPGTKEDKKDIMNNDGNQSQKDEAIVISGIEDNNKLELPGTEGKQNKIDENINGKYKDLNTGNSVGETETSKYTEPIVENGVEDEKKTGSKDALLDKSEGETTLETPDDNGELENENTDNKGSVSSVGATTVKISDEEEKNEANDQMDIANQDSEYSTTTGTNTEFSNGGMDIQDENLSTSPAEAITESPFDDKYDFDDDDDDDFDDDGGDDDDDEDAWWEDIEESNDDDDENDNSKNVISGDYYDDQDEEIEDLDDIAEEDEDYGYDDDDYDYDDDEEWEEDGNNDGGDDENDIRIDEVPPKDALIPGGDLEDTDTLNENENDESPKNLESDGKYGLDADDDDDENNELAKNVETDDKYGSDIKNDKNSDDENDNDVDTETTTYPTVTEDYYYDDDDDDDDYDYDEDDEDDNLKDTAESGSKDGYITEKRPYHKLLQDDRRYKEMTVEFERASSYSWILFLTIIVITLMFVLYINKSKLQRYFTRSAQRAVRIGDEEKNLLEHEYA